MPVAKVIEVSCTSARSFEDAIRSGIRRVTQSVRNVQGAWVKEQQLRVDNGRIVEFRVHMLVTFVVGEDELREEGAGGGRGGRAAGAPRAAAGGRKAAGRGGAAGGGRKGTRGR